jgi:ketosteroid isomerase-like protein
MKVLSTVALAVTNLTHSSRAWRHAPPKAIYVPATATTSPGQSNLNIVRSIARAWEQGDYSSFEWADAEIQFVIADGPEAGRSTGRAGLLPSLQEFGNAWVEYRSRVEEYRELDDGVLVLTYATGRGKASGVEIGEQRANLFHLRGGKVTSLVVYWDRARALADAGLAVAA